MSEVRVATIGFTQSTAERFFERLIRSGVKKLVDVRLNNTSQLSGFAKGHDLPYFLKKIAGIDYAHQPLLAPTEPILKAYKRDGGDWNVYQGHFLSLMSDRKIEKRLTPAMFDGSCLLCSEAEPHHCHRRLVCDYLNEKWGGALNVSHL